MSEGVTTDDSDVPRKDATGTASRCARSIEREPYIKFKRIEQKTFGKMVETSTTKSLGTLLSRMLAGMLQSAITKGESFYE
jgi:hypothetical protein